MEVGQQQELADLRAELASRTSSAAKPAPLGPGSKKERSRRPFAGKDKTNDKSDPDKPAFKLLTDAIPSIKGKRVCYPNMSEAGCSKGEACCTANRFVHFMPKKESLDEATRKAFVHYFDPLKAELA